VIMSNTRNPSDVGQGSTKGIPATSREGALGFSGPEKSETWQGEKKQSAQEERGDESINQGGHGPQPKSRYVGRACGQGKPLRAGNFFRRRKKPEEHTRAQFERRLKEIRSGRKSWLPLGFPFPPMSHRSGSSSSWISPWKAIKPTRGLQGYPGTVQQEVSGHVSRSSNSWTAATRSVLAKNSFRDWDDRAQKVSTPQRAATGAVQVIESWSRCARRFSAPYPQESVSSYATITRLSYARGGDRLPVKSDSERRSMISTETGCVRVPPPQLRRDGPRRHT